MDITQQICMENKQILCQSQIQSLEILTMDTIELEKFLQNEYNNNPLLEHTETNHSEYSINNISEWSRNRLSLKNASGSEREDYSYDFVAPNTEFLNDFFFSQLLIEKYTEKEWKILKYMIQGLEDDGFFRMSEEEVAENMHTSVQIVRRLLEDLRDLEPYGIFSANLSQCLIKQLKMLDIEDENLFKIIEEYLPEISEGKISVISRKLSLTTAQVRNYISIISKLNPRPLSGVQDQKADYIVPDIIVSKSKNGWNIKINDQWFGSYSINDYYVKMMNDTKDKELFTYFKEKLDRSRFILNCVEQRRNTLLKIIDAIIKIQGEYLEHKQDFKPMTMSQIADEINMHISTISRATKGKYVQFPKGTFLIRNLFCNKVCSNNSEDLSAKKIKEKIKIIVDHEDKKKPLSDAQIMELLKQSGIRISRRGVAKYRDELWIKSSFDRKER